MFGVDLGVAVKKNRQSIPVVVEKCIQYLRGCMLAHAHHTTNTTTPLSTHNLLYALLQSPLYVLLQFDTYYWYRYKCCWDIPCQWCSERSLGIQGPPLILFLSHPPPHFPPPSLSSTFVDLLPPLPFTLKTQAAFDKGDDVDFSGCKDPHVVSNVLKLYLRELPNPLLTAESYQKFLDANCTLNSFLNFLLLVFFEIGRMEGKRRDKQTKGSF